MIGLTDDDLSDWGCSARKLFTTFPKSDFTTFAIALEYNTTNGTIISNNNNWGAAYILINKECNDNKVSQCVTDNAICEISPCSCSEVVNCNICNSPSGCAQCNDGYWKLSLDYQCINCQESLGDGCLFCQDFNGCGQCVDGCERVMDSECGYYVCICNNNQDDSTQEPTEEPTEEPV